MKKLIIIIGANSGIGLNCVEKFCTFYPQHTILAISRSINNLSQIHSFQNLLVRQCDIIDFNDLSSIVEKLANSYQVEGLINCAGIAVNGDICELSTDDIHNMIEVNTKGIANVLHLVLPYMRKAKSGTIINFSSLADRYPRPNNPVYAATKSFVKSISESLRLSESKYNIRVCNVAPALIDTPMLDKYQNEEFYNDRINIDEFVDIIHFIYSQPHNICIRDIVVAPTNYAG